MVKEDLDWLTEESKKQVDHYAEHLGELDEFNPVISTEDIVSTGNIPLVIKGTRISKEIAQRILQHKLTKPLEEQVQLKDCIDGAIILSELYNLMEKYPDIKQIHENSGFKSEIDNFIRQYILPVLLAQKISVLKHRLPKEFEKTLFCTWLAVSIAFIGGFDKRDIAITYLAGIGHDLGMLHISPEIFTKEEQLSPEEWRAIKSHVVTSYLFLKSIGGLCIDAGQAVLEHHESCDGTGYPLGKTTDKLTVIGQVIGMSDSLQAIRINQLEKSGRNLRHTVPFLQINNLVHTEAVYKATLTLIKKSKIEPDWKNNFGSLGELVDHLVKRGENIGSAAPILQQIMHLCGELKLGTAGQAMFRILDPVNEKIRSSGIIEEQIFSWLGTLKVSECDASCMAELCEMELIQNELYFQLRKTRHSFIEFLAQEPNAGSQEQMFNFVKIVISLEELFKR